MRDFSEIVKDAGDNSLSYMGVKLKENGFDAYQDLLKKHGDKNIRIAANIVYYQLIDNLRREIFIADSGVLDADGELSDSPISFIDNACSRGRFIPGVVMAHGPFYDKDLDQKAFFSCVSDLYPKAVMLMAKELIDAKVIHAQTHTNKQDVNISNEMEIALVASRLLSVPIGCNLISDRLKTLNEVKSKIEKDGSTKERLEFIENLDGMIKDNKKIEFNSGKSSQLENMLIEIIKTTDYSVKYDAEDVFFRIAKMESLSESMRVIKPMYDGKVLRVKNKEELSI